MNAELPRGGVASQRTSITCSRCGKPASVPFTPTPGRPIYCRDCFSKSAPPGGRSVDGGPNRGPDSLRARAARSALPGKKRMMAQGRKTHFIFDAKAVLVGMEGGMQDEDQRSFLEGLFARGARVSTQAAQEFLEQKVADGAVTHEQAIRVGALIDKYSFYR